MKVPSLRERLEDLPLLADAALKEIGSIKKFSPAAIEALAAFHWPGNIRQLFNEVHALAILAPGDVIEADEVRCRLSLRTLAPAAENLSLEAVREEVERQHISKVLAACKGNKEQAAGRLQIAKNTLYAKLRAYGLT